MITFLIDVQPWEMLLKKLEWEIIQARDVQEKFMKHHVSANETRYLNLLSVISQEYDMLSKRNEEIFKYLKEIDLLRKRERRAVIVGKVLHVFFGAITKSNLRLIK